jgi:hypothetical protein
MSTGSSRKLFRFKGGRLTERAQTSRTNGARFAIRRRERLPRPRPRGEHARRAIQPCRDAESGAPTLLCLTGDACGASQRPATTKSKLPASDDHRNSPFTWQLTAQKKRPKTNPQFNRQDAYAEDRAPAEDRAAPLGPVVSKKYAT